MLFHPDTLDVDTIGAMTGALAGAYHGASAFPPRWTAEVERSDRLTDLADRHSDEHSGRPDRTPEPTKIADAEQADRIPVSILLDRSGSVSTELVAEFPGLCEGVGRFRNMAVGGVGVAGDAVAARAAQLIEKGSERAGRRLSRPLRSFVRAQVGKLDRNVWIRKVLPLL